MSEESREPWLESLLKKALAEGDIKNLEGHGRPLESLDGAYDPDWRLVEDRLWNMNLAVKDLDQLNSPDGS